MKNTNRLVGTLFIAAIVALTAVLSIAGALSGRNLKGLIAAGSIGDTPV